MSLVEMASDIDKHAELFSHRTAVDWLKEVDNIGEEAVTLVKSALCMTEDERREKAEELYGSSRALDQQLLKGTLDGYLEGYPKVVRMQHNALLLLQPESTLQFIARMNREEE